MKWSTPEVKQLNRELIRQAIKSLGGCTKSDVAKETALSVATCNTLLNEMLEEGEIIKQDQEVARMGRPADRFVYDPDYHHVMGISIRAMGTSAELGIVTADAMGNLLRQETKAAGEVTQRTIDEAIGQELAADSLIRSVSIGIGGVTKRGIVERCDVESLAGADLQGAFIEKYGVDVEVRNDMDFITCGIYNQRYLGTDTMAVAFFPEEENSHVGCGVIINGRVLTGSSRFSGELSYIPEGFGYSREEMKEKCRDHDYLVEYVARISLVVLTMLDPENLVILCSRMDEEDLATVRSFLMAILTSEHVPEIRLEHQLMDNYNAGLVTAAINRLDFPLSCPI